LICCRPHDAPVLSPVAGRPADPESAANVAKLYYATTLFERNVWLLRQIALWMREDLKLKET
jgi:hypothetical protein